MQPFHLRDLPPPLAALVARDAQLEFPPQGMTADVALAVNPGRTVVVKRCTQAVYLDWLRREREALEALADSGLPIPACLAYAEDWVSRQLAQARRNLPWCDGTAAGLRGLERSRPAAVPERLIHGDLALDNVLVDARGALHLVDWAGGGPGDPRHDVALALDMKPEAELTALVLEAFFAGYGAAPVDEATREWFVRLYDYF